MYFFPPLKFLFIDFNLISREEGRICFWKERESEGESKKRERREGEHLLSFQAVYYSRVGNWKKEMIMR